MPRLAELTPLALDCQTTGATPALGEVLELGWTVARPGAPSAPAVAWWVKLSDGHRIPKIIRQLTGVRDADLAAASSPAEVWRRLEDAARAVAAPRRTCGGRSTA